MSNKGTNNGPESLEFDVLYITAKHTYVRGPFVQSPGLQVHLETFTETTRGGKLWDNAILQGIQCHFFLSSHPLIL